MTVTTGAILDRAATTLAALGLRLIIMTPGYWNDDVL